MREMLKKKDFKRELGLVGTPGIWTSEGFIPESYNVTEQVRSLFSQVGKVKLPKPDKRRSGRRVDLTTE
jgi:hypothetical protein